TTRSGISRRTTRACVSAGPTKFGADPVTLAFALTLLALGFGGAFVAGLLGVGGAIVMIPLLLYVPPLIEVGALDIKSVAGVTMTQEREDRKSTRLNSSHVAISYAVFCLKKKKTHYDRHNIYLI